MSGDGNYYRRRLSSNSPHAVAKLFLDTNELTAVSFAYPESVKLAETDFFTNAMTVGDVVVVACEVSGRWILV